MDFTDMAGHKLLAALGDDAVKWAAAFQQIIINGGVPIDEALMVGWFANAIETAHDRRTGGGPVVLPDGSAFFVADVD